MKKFSLWTRLLILIGARSKCCGARVFDHGYDGDWCSNCGKKQ